MTLEERETELLHLCAAAKEKRNLTEVSEDFVAAMIHNSLSFENNLGTLDNVHKILANESCDCNKEYVSLVLNLKNAFDFIHDLALSDEKFDECKLKDLHQVLMGEDAVGGLYRNVDISIKGSNHTPPSHVKVYNRMFTYFENLDARQLNMEKIAYSHLQLAKIHPFLDGNGRCARLVMNYFLLKAGFAPVTIPYELKDEYFACLESFKVDKDINPFINFLMKLEEEALK